MNVTDDQSNYKDKYIINLEKYINDYELSKWNPLYYLYYPAEASVISAKSQLECYYSSLKVRVSNE